MIYINPTRFMHRDYGKDLRSFIKSNFTIREIVDFGNIQQFDTATTYTGIFSFIKSKNKKYDLLYRNSIDENSEKYCSEKLEDEVWYFNPPKIQFIIELIRKNASKFESYLTGILQGIATGKDEVFILNKDFIDEHKLEKEFMVKFLMGKDIAPYKINWKGKYCIYPYDLNNSVQAP